MATWKAYRPNQAGWKALANGPEIRALVQRKAEAAKAFAESISPRSDAEHRHYADSFEVEQTTVTLKDGPRAAAVLHNTVGHAAAVEWGNQATHGQGHHVLGKTADALGRLA